MMRLIFLGFLFLFYETILNSEETNILYFEDLQKINAQISNHSKESSISLFSKPIQIRGFLYPQDNHAYLLSSQPNLRSCCIGSAAKMNEQIYILNLLNDPEELLQVPVLIEGNLVAEFINFENQKPSYYRYTLKNAVIKENNQPFSWITLFISVILLIITYFGINRWSKKWSKKLSQYS